MGCSSSFDAACKTDQFQEWLNQFEVMQLSRNEIRKLFYIFSAVDVDKSGQIALAELLAHIDLERTRFTERIFSIFDEDGSGEIDFREFVLSLWNYCTLTKATLDMFAFDLYDKDGSGELSAKEVTYMLHDIYGKKECKTNFLARTVANDLKAIEATGEVLDIEAYRQFVRTHQALLFPAFQMQLALQRKILGVRFWERNAERRLKFSNGKYISVGNFILMNVDANKKTVLQADSAIAQAMGGTSHKHDREVGRMMELAGTRAARKKVVEENVNRNAAMQPTTGAELFSMEQNSKVDTSAPLTEQGKREWLASIVTMPALFGVSSKTNTNSTAGAGVSSKNGAGKNGTVISVDTSGGGASSKNNPVSPKNPKQVQVGSSKGMLYNNNNTASTINHTPPTNGRRKSFSNEEMGNEHHTTASTAYTPYNTNTSTTTEVGIATAGGIRESLKLKTVATSLAASIKLRSGLSNKEKIDTSYANSIVANAVTSNNNTNTTNENSYSNPNSSYNIALTAPTSSGNVPSGKVKNSSLTLTAIRHIDHVSPIDAWEKQPMHASTTGTSISNTPSNSLGLSSKHSGVIIADKPRTVTVDANAKPDEDKIIIHNYPTSTKSHKQRATISSKVDSSVSIKANASTKDTSTSNTNINHTSSKVHTHGASSKFDSVGFSMKGPSAKIRPSISEDQEDDDFGAADFAPSTKKSRKGGNFTGSAYAVSDIYHTDSAGAGEAGVSSKETVSKKSRRRSVA